MYFDYQLLTEGLTVRTARSFEWWNCFLEFGESVKNDEHDGEGVRGRGGVQTCVRITDEKTLEKCEA